MQRPSFLNGRGIPASAPLRWSTQRAVGSPAFMALYVPRRDRRRIGIMPSQNQEVRP